MRRDMERVLIQRPRYNFSDYIGYPRHRAAGIVQRRGLGAT